MTANPESVSPPSALKLIMELRAFAELGAYVPSLPLLKQVPKGDGHPVLVYPCFLGNDRWTIPLRAFLKSHNYKVYGWRLGRNHGYSPAMDEHMQRQVIAISRKHKAKVSLIGWSLGGVYAREIARSVPDCVRQVITLGSPFNYPQKASNLAWLYDIISGERIEQVDHRLFSRMLKPPPVPSTAIFSRNDGVVAWPCSMEREGRQTDNIEVRGSHCGLGHNPLALYAIGDRLAQAEDAWAPFDRTRSWRSFAYPNPYRDAKAMAAVKGRVGFLADEKHAQTRHRYEHLTRLAALDDLIKRVNSQSKPLLPNLELAPV